MNEILLISHGEMATGTKKAVEMIAGDFNNLDAICLVNDMSIEEFKANFKKRISKYDSESQIIVIADIVGGSPYTSALEILSENGILDKCFVIVGLNLSLVLSIILVREKLNKNIINALIDDSKANIFMFELKK